MTKPKKGAGPLEMTDAQLREAYRHANEDVMFSSNDYYKEIVRRTQEKHTKAIRWLTLIGLLLTLSQAIGTALPLLLK